MAKVEELIKTVNSGSDGKRTISKEGSRQGEEDCLIDAYSSGLSANTLVDKISLQGDMKGRENHPPQIV